MTHIHTIAITAEPTFGRDGAMFEGFLDFVAQLSLMLWSMVVLTVIIRFVGIRIYRRSAPKALVETVSPGPAVPAVVDLVQPAAGRTTEAVTNVTLDGVRRPAESPVPVAASVEMPHSAPRHRRAEHRSTT